MNEFEALFNAEMDKRNIDKETAKNMDKSEREATIEFRREIMGELDFLKMVGVTLDFGRAVGDIWINIPTPRGMCRASISCKFEYKYIGKESYPTWLRNRDKLIWDESRATCHTNEQTLSLAEIVKRIATMMN